jgi:hypothetical protein
MVDDADWTVASKSGGITTSYRREEDSSFTVKIHGGMENIPIFEQICVLKEVDLYSTWAPFCSSSQSIADIDKLDNVGWVLVGLPKFGLARDACYRSIGCDNTTIDGSIIISAQGIFDHMPGTPTPITTAQNQHESYLSDDPLLLQLDVPAPPTGIFSGRMTIHKFDALIRIKSPTSADTTIVVNVNPNLRIIPDTLIEFVMKRMLGELLAKLQWAAKRIIRDPVHNKHARLMRNEEYVFYHDWLLPKVETICRMNGWDVPAIAAFSLTKQQLLEEEHYIDSHGTKPISDDEDDMRTELSLGEGRSPSADDLVSDISFDGGRSDMRSMSAKRNIIAKYLEDQERRVRQRKEAEIAARRLRIAHLNKPKERTQTQNQRLAELNLARNRRLGLPVERTVSNGEIGDNLEDDEFQQQTMGNNGKDLSRKRVTIQQPDAAKHSKSQSILRYLYDIQDENTRFFVLFFFFITLFVTLHVDYWIQAIEAMSLHSLSSLSMQQMFDDSRWYKVLLQDVGVVLYLFIFCSIPNYLLCDIALVYTFDSLQIGSKAGTRIKQHYIDNSSLIVALLSFGIVVFSITKSLWFISIRFIVPLTMSAIEDAFNSFGSMIPDAVLSFISQVTTSVPSIFLHSVIKSFILFFYWLLFRSNFVSRGLEAIMLLSLSIGYKSILLLFGGSFDTTDSKLAYSSWRLDAFTTSRTLFLYTAVFLLWILVLFILDTKSTTKKLDGTTNNSGATQKINANKGTYSREFSSLSIDGMLMDDISGQGQPAIDTATGSNLVTTKSRSNGESDHNNNNSSSLIRNSLHSSTNGLNEHFNTNNSNSTSSSKWKKNTKKQPQQQQRQQRRPSLLSFRGSKQKQSAAATAT